ncbi:PAS domain-containing sensor histidine kinase, partial [Bacteroidota bacterium]
KKSQYFQNAVEYVGTGLLWFGNDGKIELFNSEARRLLNINSLSNIFSLDKIMLGLSNAMIKLKPGEQKLIKLASQGELKHLSVKATELKTIDKKLKLISIQNIRTELEEKELESWQNLIRVMTHEIMNSIGPISTTITAISRFFRNPESESPIDITGIDNETVEKTLKGLNILEERSIGLKEFVEKYRSITSLPKAEFMEISVSDLVDSIMILMNEKLNKENIKIAVDLKPEDLNFTADKKLVSQMIINLINNSIQALENTKAPQISIKAYKENNNLILQVSDNGKGILEENIDKIFIPFYSTTEKGSGIGLSLSRQIMRMHKGSISVKSVPYDKTVFSLRF